MAFWTSDLFDPKVNFRFKVLFKDTQGGYEEVWYASKADQPSLTIATAQARFLRHKFNFPTSYEWGDVEIVLVDPKKPLITSKVMKQLSSIAFQHNQFRSMSKTRFLNQFNLIKIISLKSDGKEGDSWTLNGAFPTNVSFSSFDYSNENLTEIKIKFKYDFAKFEDEFGVIYDPVGNQIATSQNVAVANPNLDLANVQVTQAIAQEAEATPPAAPAVNTAPAPETSQAPQAGPSATDAPQSETAPAEPTAPTEPVIQETAANEATATPEPAAQEQPEQQVTPPAAAEASPEPEQPVAPPPAIEAPPQSEEPASPAGPTTTEPAAEARQIIDPGRIAERGEETWDVDGDGYISRGESARRDRLDPSYIPGTAQEEQARRLQRISEGTDTVTPSTTTTIQRDSSGNINRDLNGDGTVTEREELLAMQLESATPSETNSGGNQRRVNRR